MTARKMDPRELMEQVGTALFGRRWRAELGESFDPPESMRFMNRALHPKTPTGVIREHHRQQMMELVDQRMKALDSLRKRVEDQPAYPQADEPTKAQLAARKAPKVKATRTRTRRKPKPKPKPKPVAEGAQA